MFEPSHWMSFFSFIIGGTGGFILAATMYAGSVADDVGEEAMRELSRLRDVEQMTRESQR